MGKVVRVTFVNVKTDYFDEVLKLAEKICVSEEHNLIVEELTGYVIRPKSGGST